MPLILIAVVVAYVVTYPVFAWTYTDLRRYPRHMWTGYGRPYSWRQATVVAYALGGVPVLVVALAWWTSSTRSELRALAVRVRADAGPEGPAPAAR